MYDEQAVILAPGAPPVSGRKAIAAFWRTLGIRGMKTVALQVIDLEQSGDLLLARGKYVMKDAQNTLIDTGKFLAQYRKTKAGWRLYSDVFNSSLETRSPLEIPDYLRPD